MNHYTEKLTSVMLDGKNYLLWVRQVTFSLISRDKLEYVTGESKVPAPASIGAPTVEGSRAIKQWRKDDTLVIGWLLSTMVPHINDLMSYQDTARDIWVKAETIFARKKNNSRIYQIQQEIL
jgi:gag-polypeptide of LTR copia-type